MVLAVLLLGLVATAGVGVSPVGVASLESPPVLVGAGRPHPSRIGADVGGDSSPTPASRNRRSALDVPDAPRAARIPIANPPLAGHSTPAPSGAPDGGPSRPESAATPAIPAGTALPDVARPEPAPPDPTGFGAEPDPDGFTPAGSAETDGTPADGTPADGTPADGTPSGGTPSGADEPAPDPVPAPASAPGDAGPGDVGSAAPPPEAAPAEAAASEPAVSPAPATPPVPVTPPAPVGEVGSAEPAGGTGVDRVALLAELVERTNAQRAAVGCAPLTIDARLSAAAQAHSEDMADGNYFAHTARNGRSPFDRIAAAGYSFTVAAENLAAGQRAPAAVVADWMASPGHRANIVNCELTQVGVGRASGGDYGTYWVQDFGTP